MDFFDIDMADAEVAEDVLDRVLEIASEEAGVEQPGYNEQQDLNSDQPDSRLCDEFTYPAAELIKIATVAFNKATDFYRATRDEDCQRWAEKSYSYCSACAWSSGHGAGPDASC
ncbi:Meiosis specific protein SPO22 [Penicillium cf. griseofulvum]|nr:Meiosis specific protein SPO22 [Penicillium cf. griseofulvum]